MPTLIDTNILLRSIQPEHPMHLPAVRALEALMKMDEMLVVALQNIAEFWNAATRPATNNGLGLTVEEAQAELAKIESFFQVLASVLKTDRCIVGTPGARGGKAAVKHARIAVDLLVARQMATASEVPARS